MNKHFFLLIVAVFFFCHRTQAQQEEPIQVVTTHEELDLSQIDVMALPILGPFMLSGYEMHSLEENGKMGTITFPDNRFVDDVIWTGENFVVKSGCNLYMLDDLETPIMTFDDSYFSIYPWDNKRIFISMQYNNKYHVFWGHLKFKRVQRLVSFPEQVVHVSGRGKSTMMVTDSNIYMFTDSTCIQFLHAWAPIRSAVMTAQGLAFSTDEQVCLLSGVENFILLFEGKFRQLLYDDRYLYVITSAGDLLKCDLNILLKSE
ncbi:MAG: hypothetical protein MJZ24_11320 [Paludibacteraceae bacterium]|nr:hypothetical protein [Paludibacteraceae bacterium]